MRVTLLWPIGDHQPGDVVDADPRLADVLVREGFARRTDGPPIPPEPTPPTVAELHQYARDHQITVDEARRRIAAELRAR